MRRNDAAAPVQVLPGIRIHAIDMVQPPGMGISPIDDMDAHQATVAAALAANNSAATPKKVRWEARSDVIYIISRGSALAVLVVPAPPNAGLVASFGSAVEPLVHAPEAVQPARV